MNAFADFELRTELDPDNTDVACNHEGSPLRIIPEETEAGSDTNTTNEPELPACTEANQGQWVKRNWQQQTKPLNATWPGHPYWVRFHTSIEGWTYEAWQCVNLDDYNSKNYVMNEDDDSPTEWKPITTVWSPFGPDFTPRERPLSPSTAEDNKEVYPTQAQLNALGRCSDKDYFNYSYLDSENIYFPWFHAEMWCYNGVLKIYDRSYSSSMDPVDFLRSRG